MWWWYFVFWSPPPLSGLTGEVLGLTPLCRCQQVCVQRDDPVDVGLGLGRDLAGLDRADLLTCQRADGLELSLSWGSSLFLSFLCLHYFSCIHSAAAE